MYSLSGVRSMPHLEFWKRRASRTPPVRDSPRSGMSKRHRCSGRPSCRPPNVNCGKPGSRTDCTQRVSPPARLADFSRRHDIVPRSDTPSDEWYLTIVEPRQRMTVTAASRLNSASPATMLTVLSLCAKYERIAPGRSALPFLRFAVDCIKYSARSAPRAGITAPEIHRQTRRTRWTFTALLRLRFATGG